VVDENSNKLVLYVYTYTLHGFIVVEEYMKFKAKPSYSYIEIDEDKLQSTWSLYLNMPN